jgi:hypothetical protein
MFQTGYRLSFNYKDGVRFRTSLYNICGEKSDSGADILRAIWLSPVGVISPFH